MYSEKQDLELSTTQFVVVEQSSMKPVEHFPKGYNTKIVCEFLGISVQTLRYWKGILFPFGHSKFYNAYEVLLLRIVKEFITYKNSNVGMFDGFEWDIFVNQLSEYKPLELIEYTFLIDPILNKIDLYTDNNSDFINSRSSIELKLKTVVLEHVDELLSFGVNKQVA